jgi:hypothetical protein
MLRRRTRDNLVRSSAEYFCERRFAMGRSWPLRLVMVARTLLLGTQRGAYEEITSLPKSRVAPLLRSALVPGMQGQRRSAFLPCCARYLLQLEFGAGVRRADMGAIPRPRMRRYGARNIARLWSMRGIRHPKRTEREWPNHNSLFFSIERDAGSDCDGPIFVRVGSLHRRATNI